MGSGYCNSLKPQSVSMRRGSSAVRSLGAADGTPDSPSLIGVQLEAIKQARS